MIVTMELDAASKRRIERHAGCAQKAHAAIGQALFAAVVSGAEETRESLVRGNLGLVMQHPGSGLAASVFGWMISEDPFLGAVGVPSDAPAARYAAIHEFGGTVRPTAARALAVPISAEAKNAVSPRDMEGLSLIPRKGRPPLLARVIGGGGGGGRTKSRLEVHWVLVSSVTIRAQRWLSRGLEAAAGTMAKAFGSVIGEHVKQWKGA